MVKYIHECLMGIMWSKKGAKCYATRNGRSDIKMVALCRGRLDCISDFSSPFEAKK